MGREKISQFSALSWHLEASKRCLGSELIVAVDPEEYWNVDDNDKWFIIGRKFISCELKWIYFNSCSNKILITMKLHAHR